VRSRPQILFNKEQDSKKNKKVGGRTNIDSSLVGSQKVIRQKSQFSIKKISFTDSSKLSKKAFSL
jgi:hypothetical protein